MRTDDGQEVLVTLALPLSARLAADLMRAVEKVAKRHGYTNLVILTDGSNRIAGTPPHDPSR